MVEQRKSITMKDVALEAGVSVGTVSRVINKEKGIKEVTLKKVEQAIKTLNYIPDYYARGMKKIEQKRLQSLYQVSGIPSFQNLLCMWKMKSIREITNYSYVLSMVQIESKTIWRCCVIIKLMEWLPLPIVQLNIT